MAKVLVADDNPHVQALVREALRPEGHEVLSVLDGLGLLERLVEANPNLLLLDSNLPGTSEAEIRQGVQAEKSLDHLRLVLLAGPLETIDPDEVTQAGVHAVLQKPLDAQELVALTAEFAGPQAETVPNGVQVVDSLIHAALSHPQERPAREALREEVEAVLAATMPALVDRITDRLLVRLRNR